MGSFCLLEARDIALSIALMLASMIMLLSFMWIGDLQMLPYALFSASLITVGSFIGHEMAHRAVARRLGYIACFRMVKYGAVMLLLTALIGLAARAPFVFGVPGAVSIGPRLTGPDSRRFRALIALAGPGTNVILSALAYPAFKYSVGPIHTAIWAFYTVNSMLAIFNSLPIPPLDGYQVLGNREFGLWFTLMVSSILVSIPAFTSL